MKPQKNTGFLSDLEKGKIIALKMKNDSFSAIAKQLNRPLSTVKHIYQRYKMRGTYKNHSSTGRPKIIDERTQRHLARASKKARHLPLAELRNDIAPKA